MADISKTVEIIFQGVDKVGDGISSAKTKLTGFGDQITAVAAPFAAFGEAVLKADAALAALAVGGIALAIKSAGDFKDGFQEIVSISTATGESVGKFEDDILAYAQNSTKSISDINASIYTAISAGVDYKDSLGLLSTAEQLAVAGKADLEEVTLLLASTMNAYGAKTNEAARYSDVFFQTVKIGQTTVPELAASLANVTGIAAAGNVPIETLGAALAALTASGIGTSEATTAIKQALSNIIKPSSEAATAAEALGIQFNAGALKSKGFEGVLKEVYTATGGNIEKMATLFGSVEALNAVMVLAQDKSGAFATAMDAMANSAGSTAAAYEVMSQNLNLATQNLQNNMGVVLTKIGLEILPQFGRDVSATADIFKSISFAIDEGAFDPVFDLLNEAGSTLQEYLAGIAKAFPEAAKNLDFTGLTESLKELAGSFSGIFDGVDLTTPEGLSKAMQAVIDTISSLINVTAGMVDAFGPMVESITSGISSFNSLDSEAQKAGGEIAAAAQVIVNSGIAIAAAVVAIAATGADLKGAFEIVIGSIQGLWDSAKVTVDAAVITIIQTLEGIVSVANTLSFGAFSGELDGVKNKLEDWKATWQDSFISNANEVRDDLAMIGDGFIDLAEGAEEATDKVRSTDTTIRSIPDSKAVEIDLTYEEALKHVQEMTTGVRSIPDKKTVSVEASADEASISNAKSKLSIIEDEKGVLVITLPDSAKLAETKRVIEDNIPSEKKLTIEAELKEAEIKATTDRIKSYFEFKGKVDVAEIEAAAEVTKAAFESINTTISSTGDLLGGLFSLWGDSDIFERGEISAWINQQLENQKKALELQESLVESQIKYYESKSRAYDRGDAMISITGDGLAPELEAFMWKVLERIQVRVAEEHSEFLLGIA